MQQLHNTANGLLLINKPANISSHSCVQKVRRTLNIKKAGHTGTLDPSATGLLLICCEKATRLTEFLLLANKSYQATIYLGRQTDTGDSEGTVIQTASVPNFTQTELDNISAQLTGELEQTPPIYSAIKHQGKPLYFWARKAKQNSDTELPKIKSRLVTIYSLHIRLNKQLPNHIDIEVECSKGTYIRTLAEQIAHKLSTLGHIVSLHRTNCGSFTIDNALSLEDLASSSQEQLTQLNAWVDITQILDIPKITVDAENAQKICHGMTIELPSCQVRGNILVLFESKLIALARTNLGALTPVKVFYP